MLRHLIPRTNGVQKHANDYTWNGTARLSGPMYSHTAEKVARIAGQVGVAGRRRICDYPPSPTN